jgi:hypothetical protein
VKLLYIFFCIFSLRFHWLCLYLACKFAISKHRSSYIFTRVNSLLIEICRYYITINLLSFYFAHFCLYYFLVNLPSGVYLLLFNLAHKLWCKLLWSHFVQCLSLFTVSFNNISLMNLLFLLKYGPDNPYWSFIL